MSLYKAFLAIALAGLALLATKIGTEDFISGRYVDGVMAYLAGGGCLVLCHRTATHEERQDD